MKKILATMIMATMSVTAQAQSAIDKRLAEARAERMDLRDQYKACLEEGGEKEACKIQVAGVAAPIEERKSSFTWHPTAVAIGAVAGGIAGGVGAVVVGALVGEVSARLIKKSQLDEAIEQKKVELETQLQEEKAE